MVRKGDRREKLMCSTVAKRSSAYNKCAGSEGCEEATVTAASLLVVGRKINV